MNQQEYEAKKEHLKSIKRAWGDRITEAQHRHWTVGPHPWIGTRLSYGEVVQCYMEAKRRLEHFIHASVYRHLQQEFDASNQLVLGG